ncbi:MAG: FAD-binding protein [Syntrophobacteraceae bacterium]
MLKLKVLHELISIVGRERCKTAREDLLTYGCDAFIYEYIPDAVVFPKSSREAADIMKVASAGNIFITPRGAGSGLGAESLAKCAGIAC